MNDYFKVINQRLNQIFGVHLKGDSLFLECVKTRGDLGLSLSSLDYCLGDSENLVDYAFSRSIINLDEAKNVFGT